MLAPVILFVYNRPNHTKKTIDALAKNYLAKDTNLFIYADGGKDYNDRNIELTRNYISSIKQKKYFKNVEIIMSSKNKGLANSVIEGVTEIINLHKKVIVLEDDIVTTKDFLNYMNEGLDYYEKNKTIWSISGFNLPIKIPKDYKEDLYLSYRASSWGWGTWSDRWEKVDWKVSDYKYFKNDRNMRKKLNRGGRDMSDMLDRQMQGLIDSWAIRWCYSQSKENMYTVYPIVSKVKNIGLDGSGTHGNITSKYNYDLYDDIPVKFKELTPDKKLLKKFKFFYIHPIKYFLKEIKRILI